MYPFVLWLDVSRDLVAPQQVLKRAEIYERLPWFDFRRIEVGVAREVLPAVKIYMTFEVRLPRIFYRRLEGHHENPLGAELPCELVGGEGFAEAHLRVPQETRDGVHVFLPARVEVGVRHLHRFGLFAAHLKLFAMRAGEALPRAYFGEHGL